MIQKHAQTPINSPQQVFYGAWNLGQKPPS
jgi:hypothetical protein